MDNTQNTSSTKLRWWEVDPKVWLKTWPVRGAIVFFEVLMLVWLAFQIVVNPDILPWYHK
jgi:hypothetical protein